ncbi:MAG TPA: hypothetical protein VGJ12_01265 [Gemmatimonadaceae bacterium]
MYELQTVGGRPVPGKIDSSSTVWDSVTADTLTLDWKVDSVSDIFLAHVYYPPSQEHPGSAYADFHVPTTEALIVRGDSICAYLPSTVCRCYVDRQGVIGSSSITLRAGDDPQKPDYVYRLIATSR